MNRIFVIDLNLLKIMDVKWNILIFQKKRTGYKLTAIPACHKRRQSPIATRGAQLKSVKIKEKAEPRTPIASRFSLGSVDKKDTFVNLLLFLLDTCLSPLTAPLWHKRPTLEWKYACIHRVSPVKRYPIP